MAIKGKGKTRSRRVIAAPPRPQLVVRKKPVLARRSTWIAVGGVVLAGILVAVFIGVGNLLDSRKLDRQAAAVQQYVNLVTAQLPATAQPLGPTSWNLFPDLDQRMADLDSGDLAAADARTEAEAFAEAAKNSADGIEAIKVRDVIPEEFPEVRVALNEAQFEMVQGLQAYESVANFFHAAADVTGDARSAVITEATALSAQAGVLFNRGWASVVNVEAESGIDVSQQPVVPTQAPVTTPPASPTATGSASPGASPTASASGTAPSSSPSAAGSSASPSGSVQPSGSASPSG
jgi:hypothetical protein